MNQSEDADEEWPQLTAMLQGYRATCVIVAAIQIGLIEHLGNSSVNLDTLAHKLGSTRGSLRRLLRALQALGLVTHAEDGVALTTMGRLLLKESSTLSDQAVLIAEEYLPAWAKLGPNVLTGHTAFDSVFGMNAWRHREQNPHLNECFNRIMVEDQVQTQGAILEAYDFSDCALLVDVGGGHGQLVSEALTRYPKMSAIVFDQPAVVTGAGPILAAAGVLPRCRMIGGSFFESVPAEGDVYVLQHILHDWEDRDCVTILRHCREAMRDQSKLLVVENLLPEGIDGSEHLAMLDLHMMVVLGGRERTRGEYETLLKAAGLSPVDCLETRGRTRIIVSNVS